MSPITDCSADAPPPVARRRTHRKSRYGCSYCKGRRIKCDELRPSCSNCVIRGLICSLGLASAAGPDGGAGSSVSASVSVPVTAVAVAVAASEKPVVAPLPSSPETGPGPLPSIPELSPGSLSQQLPLPPFQPSPVHPSPPRRSFAGGLFPLSLASRSLGTLAMAATSPHAALDQTVGGAPALSHHQLPPPSPYQSAYSTTAIAASPIVRGLGSYDATDLQLLHHFTAFTSKTFGHTTTIQRFWAIVAPETGFKHPFVLHALLAVAGLHLAQLSASDPHRRQELRRKVDEHWDFSLRLATPLLSDLNTENCDALHIFTGLTCVYIFARGPQPGSFLLFDAPEGGNGDVKMGDSMMGRSSSSLNGDGGSEGLSPPSATVKGTSSTEEWLVFFRGLRSVMMATETTRLGRRSSSSVATDGGSAGEIQSWGLMDQMFGPDAMAEEDAVDEHGEDQHMSDGDDSHRDGSSERRSSYASSSRPRRRRDPLQDGGFATRSQPMRDLRDLILQQTRAGDPDRDVYAAAFSELATSYATVYDKEMNPRIRSAQVVFGWMYHVSDGFFERVRARRPVALAIFAHFVVLLRVLELEWMTRGWPEHLMSGIYDAMGQAGMLWIRWPMERIGWLPG